jgi:sugar fermentation stimulation protein A
MVLLLARKILTTGRDGDFVHCRLAFPWNCPMHRAVGVHTDCDRRIPLALDRGELVQRPNRFVFEGKTADGARRRWHCPVTGKIGKITDFSGMPCLFTPATSTKGRRTQGTVEAISVDGGQNWIGINQNRVNGWVEQFLRLNALATMVDCTGGTIHHEVRVYDSRIDLMIEREGETARTFLELKTPINDLLLSAGDTFTRPRTDSYFDRGLRHFQTLARMAEEGNRSICALCFMYNAQPFSSPPRDRWNARIMDIIGDANARGVENWQINLTITSDHLNVAGCFPLGRM